MRADDVTEVKRLLESGADPHERQDWHKLTPLGCLRWSRPETTHRIIELFLDHGFGPDEPPGYGDQGLLGRAAERGFLQIVQMLVKRGANPDGTGSEMEAPIRAVGRRPDTAGDCPKTRGRTGARPGAREDRVAGVSSGRPGGRRRGPLEGTAPRGHSREDNRRLSPSPSGSHQHVVRTRLTLPRARSDHKHVARSVATDRPEVHASGARRSGDA